VLITESGVAGSGDIEMIEALKSDELAKRCGGPFRLTALVQRRVKELIEGARPLVDAQNKNLVEIAIQEIAEDKIDIDYENTPGISAPDKIAETE